MSYATTDEYQARYGEVSDEDVLQECLDDCSAVIDAELERRGIDHADPSGSLADRMMRVCRSMANRVMPSGGADIPVGITQMSLTTGPYNRQYTFTGGYGTPKMLDSERRMLGIGARIGFGALAGDGDD